MPLTIVANIHAVPGKEDLVKSELEKLVETTRAEPGCIAYVLHRDNDASGHFLFYETWDNRDLWQQHMAAPHLAAYMKATEGAVDRFTLNEMQVVV
jgi:quinol monooxygenase YgiN